MTRGVERNTTRTSQTGTLPVLAAFVLLVLSASQLQSQTPPGTVIRNLATVNYQASTGASFAPVTDSALVTVGSASGIAVLLAKNVDRASGTLGDIVIYTITYQALGAAVASNVVISDVVPAGATYVPASMTLNGAPLSDVTGDDAGAFAAGRVAVTIPAVTGGATGTVVFQARLDGTASPSNIARADYLTPLGADSAQSNAVQTTLLFASVSVTKLLDSPIAPAIARVGDPVLYRIRYSTSAGVIARNVIVTDTLPAGLQYVSATPAATVSGSVLTWALGDVAAGTTTDITLQTVVPATLPDSVTVINSASLAADNAASTAAAAPAVLLQLAVPGQLALVKTVDVLEVSLGETAPYTLRLQNTGGSALNDLRVSDRLPAGSRYAVGSALGVDSVTANGRDLIFYVAGPLAPGATQTVRYRVAVVSADQDVLENRAVASAEAGTIQSAESRAWVRVRRSWPLETRAVIGKVFVDENRNGRQDNGEPGIGGVDVWTDDGEITSTDSEGRFSFQNLRPGQHAYHIDAVTLPSAFDASATPIVMRDGSGWTTPRVNFAVVPAAAGNTAAGTAAAVSLPPATAGAPAAALPAAASSATTAAAASLPPFAAGAPAAALPAVAPAAAVFPRFGTERGAPAVASAPASTGCEFDDVVPGSRGDRAIIAYFQKNNARPHYVIDVEEIGRRVQAQLQGRSDCGVQVIGYTDSADVHGGPFWTNERLSVERARWVAYQLHFSAMKNAVVEVLGRGESDPLAGFSDDLLRRNRRVELRFVRRGDAPFGGTSQPVASQRGPSADVVQDARPSTPPVPVAAAPRPEPAVPDMRNAVTVPALRSASDRDADARNTLTSGPAVTVFAPADGAVLASDRVFVGVRGEPGAAVELFDGATLIAPAHMRGDGVVDFIAVPLARGPHRLRVRMKNSWGQERWDSLNVHVSGRPARFASEYAPVVLVAGGQPTDTLHVRVLDQWNVPVLGGAFVTALANGAAIVSPDQDRSSVGVQVKADSSGWLTIELSGGRDVRVGSLALHAGDAASQVPLQILPAMRPLMMTAVGRIGVGASPDAFGAATARGQLDYRTSVVVSVDSRQLDAGREEFGRAIDPLAEAQYPILGDASSAHTRSASRYAVAARLERGMDWLAFGDLSTGSFASGLALSGYDRALAGVAGHITTGAVVWQGFGATSSDRVAQMQIRGRGMSGPYDIGRQLRPGTERVVIETRALENAQRYLARQEMVRYVDYQIDYENGLLLFKQPVPAMDLSGNPVFIVVTYGADDGGAPSTVWGLRASADAHGLRARYQLDSLRIGSTFIRDGRPGADRELAGVDFGVLKAGLGSLRAELARSATPDSVGMAASIEGSVTLANGLVSLSAGWLHSDPEFHNPANVALTGGARDLRLGARFGQGGTEFRLDHSAQRFDVQNTSRSRSIASVGQKFGAWRAEARVAADHFETGTTPEATSQASELKLTWTPLSKLSVWAEGRRHFGGSDAVSAVQPDYVGGGARFRVSPGASFELNHRYVQIPNAAGYSVTTIGGRSELGFGTEAWGSYEIAGAGAAHGAALVGLNNRLRLSSAWTMHAMFERRVGLSRAPAADPLRALPFLQVEEDYWSVALGSEWLPASKPYRASLRSELRDGSERSTRLVTFAGEASLSPAFALLTRQELIAADDRQPTGVTAHRRFSSLTGLAFRPVGTDELNFLGKVELIDANNPLGGGVLTAQTGHESRRILTAEAIWAPETALELGARYAVRYTDAVVTHTDGVVQPLASAAEYAGASLDIRMTPWLGLRGEGRLLHEGTSASTRWDAAPQLVVIPMRGIEIAGGYRSGDLHDPDFAVRGGPGWFVTLGAAITEQSIRNVAGYWRDRWSR